MFLFSFSLFLHISSIHTHVHTLNKLLSKTYSRSAILPIFFLLSLITKVLVLIVSLLQLIATFVAMGRDVVGPRILRSRASCRGVFSFFAGGPWGPWGPCGAAPRRPSSSAIFILRLSVGEIKILGMPRPLIKINCGTFTATG